MLCWHWVGSVLHTYLELVLADVLLHFMQLLNRIAAALLDGFAVFRNRIKMAFHHALHAGETAMLTAVQALRTVSAQRQQHCKMSTASHNVNGTVRFSCEVLQIMVNQMT